MLSIRLLGELEVTRGAERLPLPQSKKTRALLAYLVATGRPLRREHLCSLFWEVPDDPRGALRWSLSKLRRLIDEPDRARILAGRDSVAFQGDGVEVDLFDLRALAAEGVESADTERLLRVARAVRGEFLEDLDLANNHDFQAWCVAEREEVRSVHAAVLATLVHRLWTRPEDALAHARALVRLDPECVAARADLVRLLAATGRREEAEQHYNSGLHILREGGLPDVTLRQAWQEVRGTAVPIRYKRPVTQVPEPPPSPPPAPVSAPGAPVPPPQAGTERKHVTVLVASIAEALPWEASHDPETSLQRLDPALEAIKQTVVRFEGALGASRTDGVTAVFGAPVAHEDDAVRACYAALAMRAVLEPPSDAALTLRIGLHSGEVVVRPAGDERSPAVEPVGPVVKIAERVEQAADPGTIALTRETLRRAEGFVRVRPFPALHLGPEPVDLFALDDRAPPRSRWQIRSARGLSAFVGRRSECNGLRRALSRVCTGHGEVVAVVGEPGMGKSRLVHEFLQAAVPQGWMVLETSAGPQDVHAAYLPISGLLRSWFGIGERDVQAEVADRVQVKIVAGHPELLPHLPALLTLLDLPVDDPRWQTLSPMQRRRQTLDAVKALVMREARRQPLVLVLEDLHWIDAPTQAALDTIVESLGALPILMLVTFRPEYRHGWAGKSYFSQIRLNPFVAEDADTLLQRLLGGDPGLLPLRRALAIRTEGTPLFIEEAVRALAESGALEGQPGRYHLARPVDGLELPSSIQAVIAARIDRLPPRLKGLLQIASVIGRDVPVALLRPVAGLTEEELYDGLSELQSAEFLFETRLPPDLEFTFKHALTHEVAYASVLRERRRALHVELLHRIEENSADRLDEQVDQLARHAAAGELWDKAVGYLFQAAGKAIRRSAHLEAADLLKRGLGILARLPETTERLRTELAYQKSLGVTMMAARGWGAPEVADAYARARVLCERLDDQRELFAVLRGQGQFHMIRGELDIARQLGQRCIALFAKSRDPGVHIEMHHLFWSNSFFRGDYDDAGQHASRGMALYRCDRHHQLTYLYSGHDPGVCCRTFSGLMLWQRGFPDAAVRRCREAYALAEETGHPLTLALAEWALGYVHLFRREPAEAQEWAEQTIAVCERYLLPLLLSQGLFQLGWALAQLGSLAEGIARMEEGLTAIRATGAEMGLPYLVALLGEAYGKAGRRADGLRAMDRALETAARHGANFQAPEILRLKGDLLLCGEDAVPAAAEACLVEAVTAARRQGALGPELRAATSLARLLQRRGRADAAAAMIAPLLTRFEDGADTPDLRDARAVLTA
ncbi:AAA family ATPase [Azospirillum canadense]|uniref:AAA family ATPase n=1 Tax=Azospirillum canadense TaxID=403962 RepID=UPI00222671D9|nr:AAA family ATPase [Azospirillum canadense]MCW2239003.1 DNA-binding SARP family transcriptional activator/class 3 adenylate cyclase/predicted ATPase [Azospirillum canadense]